MYKNIMIATDGSELAAKAVNAGLELAKSHSAHVIFVTVTEPWPLLDVAAQAEMGVKEPVEMYDAIAEKSANSTLAGAAAIAATYGVKCRQVHIKNQHPAKAIVEASQKNNADLIVLASHGRRGLDKMLLGSVTVEVLTGSIVPILVVK
jgi:nucleotide-binding universal stress UspA family protein